MDAAKYIDRELKKIGFIDGISLNTVPYTSKPTISLVPTINYDNNINGGNTNNEISIGSLNLVGDASNVAISGMVAGVRLDSRYRLIKSKGSYIDAGASAEKMLSNVNGFTIERFSGGLCSVNHISAWWYVDACTTFAKEKKKLKSTEHSEFLLSVSKLFEAKQAYHRLSLVALREKNNDYWATGIEIHHQLFGNKRKNLSYSLKIVDPDVDRLGLRRGVELKSDVYLLNRSFELSTSFTHEDAGRFLGYKFENSIFAVQASVPIYQGLVGTIGYTTVDSTIDSFDDAYPMLGARMRF